MTQISCPCGFITYAINSGNDLDLFTIDHETGFLYFEKISQILENPPEDFIVDLVVEAKNEFPSGEKFTAEVPVRVTFDRTNVFSKKTEDPDDDKSSRSEVDFTTETKDLDNGDGSSVNEVNFGKKIVDPDNERITNEADLTKKTEDRDDNESSVNQPGDWLPWMLNSHHRSKRALAGLTNNTMMLEKLWPDAETGVVVGDVIPFTLHAWIKYT